MREADSSNNSFKTILWLSVALLVLTGRVVSDVIALASGSFDSTISSAIRVLLGFAFIACTGFIVWGYAQVHAYRSRRDFAKDFTRLLVLLFVAVLPFGDGGNPTGISEVLFANILGAERIFCALFMVVFLYRALNLQRTSQTRRYTRVIIIGTVGAFVTALISEATHVNTFRVLILLLCAVLAIIMYLAVKRRTWVHLLSAKEKRTLLLLTFVGMILGIVSMAFSWSHTSELYISLREATYGFQVVMAYASTFLTIFCERVFWTTLFSLPNSSMIERRTFEFSSVAYLNRIAAESTDIEKLYATVTSLAMQATRGSAAWSFSLDQQSGVQVRSQERLNVKQIQALNDADVVAEFAATLVQPVNIEYMAEHPTFRYLSRSVESFAQSMIIAPLRSGRDFVGAIIVTHAQPFSFETDDVQAVSAFASSASVAIENARLVEDSLEKERYHKELLVGREIQRKLLPQTNPQFDKYEIFASSAPALEVGGDYYDFYHLADGSPCVLIADVSGKGISAAFYMAKLKGVAIALARHATTAQQLVEDINATLFGTMERQMYITMMAVHLGSNGHMSIVRAGHTPALLVRPGGTSVIKPRGLGVGLAKPEFFRTCIQTEQYTLRTDEALLLFTDGINEARNHQEEEFGLERLESIVQDVTTQRGASAESISQKVMHDVLAFSNHAMQHDDMTLIVIRRAP